MARQYACERGEPERVHFIARRQSYHGNTLGTMAVSGHVARRAPYEPILPHRVQPRLALLRLSRPRRGRERRGLRRPAGGGAGGGVPARGPDRVIAFVAETVVGATAGCVTAVPGYFPAMRAVCDRHGALLILDEVMCGMGRTGTTHAWEQEGVTPDLQAVAKGLGGGYAPVGALLVGPSRCGAAGRVGRVRARPHLPGAPDRLRRRRGGAAHHRARKDCSAT